MADINVLEGDNSNKWTLVFHIPVPDTTNAVGVSNRTALVRSKIGLNEDGRRTILLTGDGTQGTISAADEALLDAGSLFEVVRSFLVESGGTSTIELRNSIREFYASTQSNVLAGVGSRLRYFGHTESAA